MKIIFKTAFPFMLEMKKILCGRYRALKKVDKMIVEKTGELCEILNTVILEGIACEWGGSRYFSRNCYLVFGRNFG